MHTSSVIATLVGGAAVLVWRIRETKKPVTARKLLLPPIAMSTGFCMFIVPETRVPVTWGLLAFAAGAIFFAYPLVHTSSLTRVGDAIILKRSRAFLVILLALLAVRLAARSYVEQYVDALQTGSLFFLLAFGMLLPWRMAMYRRYRKLVKLGPTTPSPLTPPAPLAPPRRTPQ